MLCEIKVNQFAHLQKLVNQSTLIKAHVVEITKACTVASMKARNSLVLRCKEKYINWKKEQNITYNSQYLNNIFHLSVI